MAKEEKKDDFEQATKVLKRVLPMMVQNHIPARPDHYSVLDPNSVYGSSKSGVPCMY